MVIDGGDQLAECPDHITPEKEPIRQQEDPTANLEIVVKRKISAPAGNRTPSFQSSSP
jgi:hypothetical protein